MRNTRNLRITEFPTSQQVGVMGQCLTCKEIVVLPTMLKDDWRKFLSGEGLIQDIFPYLTPADREFLISRVCGPCFDRITKEEDET